MLQIDVAFLVIELIFLLFNFEFEGVLEWLKNLLELSYVLYRVLKKIL